MSILLINPYHDLYFAVYLDTIIYSQEETFIIIFKSILLFTDINDTAVLIVLMLRVNDAVLVHQQ